MEITKEDLKEWKRQLDAAGIEPREGYIIHIRFDKKDKVKKFMKRWRTLLLIASGLKK